ncbi:MAG: hypothetical protein AAB420_02525 [Patescibacteria group bacterium]
MNENSTVISVIDDRFRVLWDSVAGFVPTLVAAIVLFLLGWIVAIIVGKLVWHLVGFIQLDKGLESVGFKRVWERSGYKLDSGKFFYELVKWFIIVLSLMVVTDVLGLSDVANFLEGVVMYLPNVFVAAIVLIIGVMIAKFVEHAIRGSVKAAELHSANFLGLLARWGILVFSFLIALEQLGVGTDIIRIAVTGVIVAGALAFGLAFGLGGKDHADQWLTNWKKHVQD